MTATTEPDVFSGIPLFAALGNDERADLHRLLQPRAYEAQRAIFWIGEPGDDFFIIEHGSVIVCYPDETGREVTLAVLGPGQFFGELSLLDGGRRTATARAQGDVRLLVLGRNPFHEFLKRHPSSAIHVMEVLGRRQRDNLDKLRGIKNANEVVAERRTPVQRFVERVAAVFASEIFLIANLIFFVTWMGIQTIRYQHAAQLDDKLPKINFLDQPPTFFWLGFMVTLEAIILSIFVLNSQKRQASRDKIMADLDYQVNRKAQLEIMQLHEKLDRLHALVTDRLAAAAPTEPPAKGLDGA